MIADQLDKTSETIRLRWYHLTPDRLIVALLPVEGLLWLSERFQWFGFNEHKGWTVLVAIASIGVAMLVMLLWLVAALLFRVRFQFSIRSLLVLTVAVAIPCSWLAVEMKEAREQRAAVEEIRKLGGGVYALYDYEFTSTQQPPGPVWLRRLLGDDCFVSVVKVMLADTRITDVWLGRLKGWTRLQELELSKSKITDAGLKHLKGLTQLRQLFLGGTKVTDAGLEHLRGLMQLQDLRLNGTQVTDAGLECLKGLPQLRVFVLDGTHVTDAGVQRLRQALPKCYIQR